MRVQAEHWATLLDFCEQCPWIITNKFEGPDGRMKYNEAWEKVTVLLNSLGYGTKTKEEWKKVCYYE